MTGFSSTAPSMDLSDMDLRELPLTELTGLATGVRDEWYGDVVTFSPKVFIPLTNLCRDRCGYCTFAVSPKRVSAPFLEPEQILAIADAGARAGCHEALFTLGESPETRYDVAREWLVERGYGSTTEYLTAMCALVTERTGLLAHANAGAISAPELAALRRVAPSQGMMIESLVANLPAHRGAPDKAPERRLETLEAAGRLSIPFTTGILVGIGESVQDRITALRSIADSHLRHGHVQEVIVQNFVPKKGTLMRNCPPAPTDDYLRAIATARLVLPPEVHVQAPPNLSVDHRGLLESGIDDWGGVSPVTVDHVNPEKPWPQIDRLAVVAADAGKRLRARLTVYPSYIRDRSRWLDPELHEAVMGRCAPDLLAELPTRR